MVGTLGNVVFGGALIGLALATLLILTGRIMSASGMIGSLLGGREGLAATSIAFLAGLVISPALLIAFGFARQVPLEPGWPWLIVGGVLVGFGARLGDSSVLGAISGLARQSRRAIGPILAIMAGAGIAMVLRQVLVTGGVS